MKAERGKVEYEETRKRPRDTSQSSGSGNQRRRVFIPYSAVPRAPNAPKSSGYAPRPQTPNNAGGTNYHSAMGTPGSGACFTCGQPGHYMKECPHNTSVRGAPPPKKFTKPPVAGHGRLTHRNPKTQGVMGKIALSSSPRTQAGSCLAPALPSMAPAARMPPAAPWPAIKPTAAAGANPSTPLSSLSSSLSSARANPRLGRSPSPPLPASPRPANTATSSASLPSSSPCSESTGDAPNHRHLPLLLRSREGFQRPSPPLRSSSGHAVFTNSSTVSRRPSWYPPLALLRPVSCRRHAPAPASA
nr:uncharacterized protein LOC127328941 [Lolium perenne]